MNFMKRMLERIKILFMWTLGAAVTVTMLVAAYHLIIAYRSTGIFDLRKIIVMNEKILEPGQIIDISKIKKGKRIMDIDKAAAIDNLNASPYIESSKISLIYPATLIIEITETEPIAFANCEGELRYVDRQGDLLGKVKPKSGYDLPIINSAVTPETVEFLNLSLKTSPLMYHQISEIECIDSGIELYLSKSSTKIIVGKDEFPKKIVILENFLKEEYDSIPFGRVDYIDLRFDDQVVMKEFRLAEK
jgi:cell division septal protein FtsQ